jgi:ABC-type glutathione transport system ATPase component
MSSAPKSPDTLLEARDIVFSHPTAADGWAFELRMSALAVCAGEVLAFCGPSGSGKSTLLAILAGLLRPHAGQVWLGSPDGPIELYRCSSAVWRRQRRHFGFVHQDPREYLNDRRTIADIVADPLNIHDLPGMPVETSRGSGRFLRIMRRQSRRERRARALAALEKVGLTHKLADRKPAALSGGQRQRVAIARALVAGPRLVFLDEPTSALDVSVQATIIELLLNLRQVNSQTAFVLVTHDLPLARQIADRVAILDHGQLVELGDIDQVFRQPAAPVTRALLGLAKADLAALNDSFP